MTSGVLRTVGSRAAHHVAAAVAALALGWATFGAPGSGCRGSRCHEAADCGFGEVCDAGVCIARSCTTSAQCPLEHHCDDEDGACVPGCAVDDDCYSGQTCGADAVCVDAACEDTRLDCGYAQWCEDGTCVDASEPYCAPCTADAECGAGNLCWMDAWCAIDCSATGQCPGGFDCAPLELPDGQTRQMCVTACWIFTDGR